jgi:hypothetical protein
LLLSGEIPSWNITNKYYTAKVRLEVFHQSAENSEIVPIKSKNNEVAAATIPNVGGCVFFSETFNEKESLASLKAWHDFVTKTMKEDSSDKPQKDDEEGPEVQLAVVGKFETENAKNIALQWALKYGIINTYF